MLKTTSYPDAVIEMQNVGIRYGQGAEVLSDIKLSLKRGSFHFLTGKSGAGKTSLLSMMYLAQKPSRGIVSVFGKNVNFTNRDSLAMLRRKIGVVFQDFRLLEHLSAFDNVALPLRVCGMEEKEVKKRVTELLQWVELDKHIKKPTSTLSGGEKQRISIARAMLKDAPIIILDEATASVDPENEAELQAAIEALTHNKTIVMIAHRLKTVRNADQILVLDGGHIVQRGTHEELLRDNEIYREVYESQTNGGGDFDE